MQINTLTQDISNNIAYIAQTTSVSTQCAYFSQFLAYFNGTLGISLPNSEGESPQAVTSTKSLRGTKSTA